METQSWGVRPPAMALHSINSMAMHSRMFLIVPFLYIAQAILAFARIFTGRLSNFLGNRGIFRYNQQFFLNIQYFYMTRSNVSGYLTIFGTLNILSIFGWFLSWFIALSFGCPANCGDPSTLTGRPISFFYFFWQASPQFSWDSVIFVYKVFFCKKTYLDVGIATLKFVHKPIRAAVMFPSGW